MPALAGGHAPASLCRRKPDPFAPHAVNVGKLADSPPLGTRQGEEVRAASSTRKILDGSFAGDGPNPLRESQRFTLSARPTCAHRCTIWNRFCTPFLRVFSRSRAVASVILLFSREPDRDVGLYATSLHCKGAQPGLFLTGNLHIIGNALHKSPPPAANHPQEDRFTLGSKIARLDNNSLSVPVSREKSYEDPSQPRQHQ
jgi:hypothetical protein